MPRLALVLTSADLPEAELRAAELDGELFRVGDGYCAVDEVESRRHRALSLAAVLPPRLIAERRTAAWVLGLLDAPPTPLEVCAAIAERARPSRLGGATIREVVIGGDEVLELGGLRLTTPLRTALDLARFEVVFGEPERRLVAGLAGLGGFGLVDCVEAIDGRRNLPAGRQALERLARSLPDQPALTRYTS
jgi:hypothetical protein